MDPWVHAMDIGNSVFILGYFKASQQRMTTVIYWGKKQLKDTFGTDKEG